MTGVSLEMMVSIPALLGGVSNSSILLAGIVLLTLGFIFVAAGLVASLINGLIDIAMYLALIAGSLLLLIGILGFIV